MLRSARLLLSSRRFSIPFFRCQLCKSIFQLKKPGAIAFSNRCRRILLLFFGQRLQRFIKFSPCVGPAPNHPDVLRQLMVAHRASRKSPSESFPHAPLSVWAGTHTGQWPAAHSRRSGTATCRTCWPPPSRVPSVPATSSHRHEGLSPSRAARQQCRLLRRFQNVGFAGLQFAVLAGAGVVHILADSELRGLHL